MSTVPAPTFPTRVGRVVGGLLLAQLVGLILPFVLVLPITGATFLQDAAGHAFRIRVAVLLLFANGALTIGLAVVAFPVLRERVTWWALWLPALSVIWFAMQAVDNAQILSLLSLSRQYTEAGGETAESLRTIGEWARASRTWAHYTALLVIEAWFFVFYVLLFRSRLVPRPLAAFGVGMALVHAAGITGPTFLGLHSAPALAVSLALSHLALGLWLVVKGFR